MGSIEAVTLTYAPRTGCDGKAATALSRIAATRGGHSAGDSMRVEDKPSTVPVTCICRGAGSNNQSVISGYLSWFVLDSTVESEQLALGEKDPKDISELRDEYITYPTEMSSVRANLVQENIASFDGTATVIFVTWAAWDYVAI